MCENRAILQKVIPKQFLFLGMYCASQEVHSVKLALQFIFTHFQNRVYINAILDF